VSGPRRNVPANDALNGGPEVGMKKHKTTIRALAQLVAAPSMRSINEALRL
jgi:hypothetical protein